MKIAIIGAGAMGSLYGAKLSEGGHEVWLIDIMREHVESIKTAGLIVEEKDEKGNFAEIVYRNLNSTMDPLEAGIAELAIIFVKSTMTGKAVKENRAVFGRDTVALTLQNGLGNLEAIECEIGTGRTVAGTTAHGATMLGPGKIRHAGIGKTLIGELDGIRTERLDTIVDIFVQAGLDTEWSQNVVGLLWDKLLVNTGINALTALSGQQNGKLIESRELKEILEMAVEEGMLVAAAKGILLSYEDPVAHTKEICAATAENKSSMLQDVLNGRMTEIDMINGAIVKEGKALGISTPVNTVLSNLIKAKQYFGG